MKNAFQTILLSSIVCAVFITGNYLHAQWTSPTAQPPGNNVAAPINTSSSNQAKSGTGRIGAHNLYATNQVIAEGQMRAPQYCDMSGGECIVPGEQASTIPSCIVRTGGGTAMCQTGEVATGGGCHDTCETSECSTPGVSMSRPRVAGTIPIGPFSNYAAFAAGKTAVGWQCATVNGAPTSFAICCS